MSLAEELREAFESLGRGTSGRLIIELKEEAYILELIERLCMSQAE